MKTSRHPENEMRGYASQVLNLTQCCFNFSQAPISPSTQYLDRCQFVSNSVVFVIPGVLTVSHFTLLLNLCN